MFLTTETIIESPLDLIKSFADPGIIYCLSIIFVAFFLSYSIKTQKYKKLSMVLTAILIIISFIVYLRSK